MIIPVNLTTEKYDIVLEREAIKKVGKLVDLKRRVFIVTDSGVPKEYVETVSSQCETSYIECIPEGEDSKSFEMLQELLSKMYEFNMSSEDLVVAVGGGVVGDLSGLAASLYMRGVDFVNVPTTLLSQVDSSIGGKTAVNFLGTKNLVGTFHNPKSVIIDVDTLNTLSSRLIHEGLAEVIKMAITFDEDLLELLENTKEPFDKDEFESIIGRAVTLKLSVVTEDEKDNYLRHTLNFGHTIGHALESVNKGELLHGECVALGMLPMCSKEIQPRLISILKKYELPYEIKDDFEKLKPALLHDKKTTQGGIHCVLVEKIGKPVIKKLSIEEIADKYSDFQKGKNQ